MKWLHICITSLGIAILAFVFFLTLRWNVLVSTHTTEAIFISSVPSRLYFYYFGILITIFISYPLLKKINSNLLFVILITFFSICGLYLVFNADPYLRGADPGNVWKLAKSFNRGDFVGFKNGEYLNIYPFQLGIVTFDRILAHFSTNITFLYFVGLVCTDTVITIIWAISKLVYRDNAVQNITIILSIMFTPFLFNILFVYGNVYGLTFMFAAVYCQLLSFKARSKKKLYIYSCLVFILLAIAYMIKTNFEIGIIAVGVIYFIKGLQKHFYLLMTLLVLFTIPTVNVALEKGYTLETGRNISLAEGTPKSTYLVMGLTRSYGRVGWYNSYNQNTYIESGYNTKKADKKAKKDLAKRLKYLATHRKYTAKLLLDKEISTWTDSTYQSIWNGPLPTWGGKVNTKLMKLIYIEDGKSSVYKFIRYTSVLVVWSILIFTIFTLSIKLFKKSAKLLNSDYLLYATLFFIGGFVFHTFWETKSQYVYQYTATLIPVASVGICVVMEYLWNTLLKIKLKFLNK